MVVSAQGGIVFDGVVREGIPEVVTFELRVNVDKKSWRSSYLGRG